MMTAMTVSNSASPWYIFYWCMCMNLKKNQSSHWGNYRWWWVLYYHLVGMDFLTLGCGEFHNSISFSAPFSFYSMLTASLMLQSQNERSFEESVEEMPQQWTPAMHTLWAFCNWVAKTKWYFCRIGLTITYGRTTTL